MINNFYDYKGLIKRFLDREISANDFEQTYLNTLKSEWNDMSGELHDILEFLFFEVDAYVDDPDLLNDGSGHYIDEIRLRESAAKTLQKLQVLKNKP